MQNLAINNRDNIINSYGTTPTLPFDVEGLLVDKSGKNIKVESMVASKLVEYTLRLKDPVEGEIGEDIKIDKEDIVSYKVEEKEEIANDSEETRKVEEILGELALEYTEENVRMVEHLLRNGIQISQTNIKSYIKSREFLNKIIDKLDTKSAIKLMDRGINLEEENLQRISEALEDMEDGKSSRLLSRFFQSKKDLTYKEAEEIGKEVYGQKMGKDVYDTIIQLHKEKLPITKENIDKTVEVLSKLKNLKTVKDDTYVRLLNEEMEFNIESLFRANNSYTKASINANEEAKHFEGFTIVEETNIDSLKIILSDLQIGESPESLNILREFIVNNMEVDKDKYEKVIGMKAAVKDLLGLLDVKTIGRLSKENVNILEEDIFALVDELKNGESSKEIDDNLTEDKIREIKEQVELLGSIKDKDLLNLIKKDEDFTLRSLKEIIESEDSREFTLEEKTVAKTIHISKIFTSLGQRLNFNTIALTLRNQERLSLENLYINNEKTAKVEEVNRQVDQEEINHIQEEYLKLRNNLTTNMVKESIKTGKIIEHMPIDQLNKFIEEKINKYKAIDQMTKDLRNIKGNQEKIIPLIMKNNLQMTLKEIKDINSYLNGEKGLANILKSTSDPQNLQYKEEYKEAIKLLGEKVSDSLKNGDKGFKEDYKDLVNSLNNPENSSGENKENPKKDVYIQIQEKISKKDMLMQIPVKIGDEYKNLNLIVPDVNKAIDKNNMSFYISLDTDNLGLVDMDIQVIGKGVTINMGEANHLIDNKMVDLEKSLEKIGYTLKNKARLVVD